MTAMTVTALHIGAQAALDALEASVDALLDADLGTRWTTRC